MSFFPEYLVKVSVTLAIVYLFYQLVLRKLTFYTWNRFYLLGYCLFSFIIPFLDISPVLEKNRLAETVVVNWIPVWTQTPAPSTVAASGGMNIASLVTMIILAGMFLFFARLAVQVFSFVKMKNRAVKIPADGMQIYQVDGAIIPFSFGNAIFINRSRHEEAELDEIIRHEWVHVKQRHSIDILFSELLCLFNWFNPFAWMLRKAIRQNLEFIADRQVLEGGIDRRSYQYLLLKVTGNNELSIATQFNFSSLKKRIAMMNKLRSHKVNLLRFLFLLPLIAVVLVSFRQQFGNDSRSSASHERMIITDTVPRVIQPNEKGYFIDVVGEGGDCTVVVRDKNGKEVERVLLSDWKKKDAAFTNLYGKILPPPPPPPPAPVAPSVPVPAVRPTPSPVADGANKGYSVLDKTSDEFEITDKKAYIKLRSGKVENYDLTDKKQRAAFEEKYGKIINVATTAPASPALVDGANLTYAVSDNPTLFLTKTVAPATPGKAVTTLDITPSANGANVISPALNNTLLLTPVPAGTGVSTTTARAPGKASLAIIDDYGHVISGREEIVITINANTTEKELKQYKSQMKAKGVDLDFENIKFNKAGKLESVGGTMRANGSLSNFQSGELGTLLLAMIRNGDDVIFKVNSSKKFPD